jgi:hypothetical protein
MLSLPNVTLVAVSSVELEENLLALSLSSFAIEFYEIKFLTSAPIRPQNPNIKIELIPPLDFLGYSKFILGDLDRYIDTPYCLIIQADGFVLNPERWQDQFLQYDFIGAPWPDYLNLQPDNNILDMKKNRVGNGGFSMRSKKLLAETAKINFDYLSFPSLSEDLIVCHFMYEKMIGAGIKFPKPELAAQFSVESPNASFGQSPNTSFGFHGKALRDIIFSSINK